MTSSTPRTRLAERLSAVDELTQSLFDLDAPVVGVDVDTYAGPFPSITVQLSTGTRSGADLLGLLRAAGCAGGQVAEHAPLGQVQAVASLPDGTIVKLFAGYSGPPLDRCAWHPGREATGGTIGPEGNTPLCRDCLDEVEDDVAADAFA